MTLDFIQGTCFGKQPTPSWLSMLNTDSISDIISNSNTQKQFENSLVKAVNSSYLHLATLEFKDIDSDIVYVVKFDNIQKKWIIEIKDSANAEVSLEEKTEITKSDEFSKLIKKLTLFIFETASNSYIKFVVPMIEEGNFLKVDEAKSEAIKDFLEDRELKTAFEKKSFIK